MQRPTKFCMHVSDLYDDDSNDARDCDGEPDYYGDMDHDGMQDDYDYAHDLYDVQESLYNDHFGVFRSCDAHMNE
jgi:hypothetical protein